MSNLKIQTQTAEQFTSEALSYLSHHIQPSLAFKKRCDIAFPGGSSIVPLLEKFTDTDLNWQQIHLWLSDERYLPNDHPDSNYKQLTEYLGKISSLPKENLNPLKTTLSIETAASEYQSRIQQANNGIFDIIILGMGEDGHIASLFPGHTLELSSPELVVPIHNSPKPPPQRLSFTFKIFERAINILLLVKGEQKKSLLKQLEKQVQGTEHLPVAKLLRTNKNVTIITN